MTVPTADPGGDVLRVFAGRCAYCHSSQATEVKGGMDYILDLKRLAADREKVSPGDPDNSNLWKLVSARNMPPNGSPTGPLNAEQLEAIRAWIAAGAPAALPAPTNAMLAPPAEIPGPKVRSLPPAEYGWGDFGPTPPYTAPVAPVGPNDLDATGGAPPARESLLAHWVRWAGELHLLLLHFPIVCLLAAGIAEGRSWWRGQVSASATASFCIWVAALVAVPTVVCGWVYAAAGHGTPGLLPWHQWLGTAGGAMALLTALVHSHGGLLLLPRQHALARRSMLGISAALVVVAAHLGGKMAFGPGFLGW
jgi:hypothetical protein